MVNMQKNKKRILVLSAKTGGGHRAAALAVIKKLDKISGLEIIHHDIFDNLPRPINKMPKFYSSITKVKTAWSTLFKLTEGSKQSELTLKAGGRVYKKSISEVLQKYDPDVILSFHFAANSFLREAKKLDKPVPFITAVTDLATAHPMWFDRRNDLIIVPSTESYVRARNFGVTSSKLKIIGLPIDDKFEKLSTPKNAIKTQLGWPKNKATVLIMSGGDGMGKINSLVKKLDSIEDNIHLAIITGRNENLKYNLLQKKFKHEVSIYGFREDIADMMHASDILLTKAGPGTIVEGIVARLPIVLYDFLPGQEEGNLMYVVENMAGVWASTNALACTATQDILMGRVKIGGSKYEKIRLRHIEAADKIAQIVSNYN